MGALDFSGNAEPVDGALDFSDASLEAHNRAPSIMDVAKAALVGYIPDTAKALGWGLEKMGVEHGTEMRKAGAQTERDIVESMTPGGQRAYSASVFEGDGLSDLHLGEHPGGALAMGAFRSAPQMAMMAPIGAPVAAGVSRVIPAAARSAPGLKGLLARNAPGALGFGGAEGLQAATQNAEQTQSEIEGTSHAELEKSPRYLELLETMGREEARKTLASEAASDVFKRTLPWTGGVGIATGGGALGELVKPGAKSVLKGIVKGAGEEALQEAPQSAGEELIQNLAKRDYVDPTQDPWKGVAAAGASGAAIGGVTGGALGGGAHAFSGRTVDGEVTGRETAVDPLAAARGAAQDTESAAAVVRRTVDSIKQRVAAMGAQPKGAGNGNEQSGDAAADETGARAPAQGAEAGRAAPGVSAETSVVGETSPAAKEAIARRRVLKVDLERVGEQANDAREAGDDAGFQNASDQRDRIVKELAEIERSLDTRAHEAASSPKNDRPEPTDAQIRANNAKLGHADVWGMDISFENPAGSTRSDKQNQPPKWSVEMKDHYGYIKRTTGFDKDHLDAFVKPGTSYGFNGPVYIVNQGNDEGKFDEHKTMIGYGSQDEAKAAYLANYDDPQRASKRIRSIVSLPMEKFKEWAYHPSKGPSAGELILPATHYLDAKHVIRAVTPEQGVPKGMSSFTNFEAARDARLARLKGVAKDKKIVDVDRDSIITAVQKLGGINMSHRLDIIGDDKGNSSVFGTGHLFTKAGHGPDDMATRLGQYGYLTQAELDDVDGGVQAPKDKIRDEFDGHGKHFSLSGTAMEREAEANYLAEEEYDREAAALADQVERPDDWSKLTEDEQNVRLDDLFGADTRERTAPSGAEAGARDREETLEQRPGEREPGQDDEEVDGERPKASRRADAKEVAARTDSLFDAPAAKPEAPAADNEIPEAKKPEKETAENQVADDQFAGFKVGDEVERGKERGKIIDLVTTKETPPRQRALVNWGKHEQFVDLEDLVLHTEPGAKPTPEEINAALKRIATLTQGAEAQIVAALPESNAEFLEVASRAGWGGSYGGSAITQGRVEARGKKVTIEIRGHEVVYSGHRLANALREIFGKAQPQLELTGQTEAEAKADVDAKQRADDEKKKKEAAPAPEEFNLSGSDRKADVAAAHGQQDLLAAPAKSPLPEERRAAAERFEIGKSLTKTQRKTVLASLVDVYKAKGAEKESKGVDRNGNDVVGYVHSPELFEKSDITGAMVRYHVTLPDGRIAHPTELFPNYTQSDIDASLSAQRERVRQMKEDVERTEKLSTDTAQEQREYWQKLSDDSLKSHGSWRTIAPPSDRTLLSKEGKFNAVFSSNKDLVVAMEDGGWKRVDWPSADQKPMASRQSENIEDYKPQTKTGKSGQPLFWNDHIALAKPDFQHSLADGERTVGYGIYDVKNLDAEGKPTKVGSLLMDLGEDDKVVGLQNIEIRQPLRQSGKGLGETVIATLLAHNGALPIRIHNIQHHRDDGWDALPFWKKMGTQLDNFSTDPEVEINGWLSRTDYLKARGVGGKLSRGLNRATDLPAESGTADDGRGRRGEGDRGRARAGGVVQSAAVGAGAAQDRLRADAGGEGAGERGRAGTSSGNGQGLTPEQVRARLIEAFGPKIDTLLQDKVLNIVETPADLPPKLAAVSQSLDEAWYDPKANDGEGAIYFIASGLRPERVVPVLLHELGEHYNLPKMLGADGYAALHREVRALHARGTSSAVEDAWRHVRENYPSLKEAGVDFASEVIAKVGESAAGRNLPFFKRLLAAVRTWLLKLGLKANLVRNLTDEDLRTLVEASARQAIRKAGSAMAFGREGLRSAKPGVFYSELARKVGDLKLEAAPAAQWKGTIKGLKGVKADEIEWSGINDWLEMQVGKVTKGQVLGYLRENGVRVEETVLGETGSYTTHIDQLVVDLDAKGYDIINEPNLETGDPEPVGLKRRSDKRTFDLFTEADRREDFDASIDDLPEDVAALAEDLRVVTAEPNGGADAKFENYTLPGGENYRELLLTLPSIGTPAKAINEKLIAKYGGLSEAFKAWTPDEKSAFDAAHGATTREQPSFRSSHFDQPNILAHVRFNERTDAEGKKVLFLEEIQSDWAQKGKRSGFMGTTEEHAKAFFAISDADWAKASAEDRAAYRQEMLDATKDGRISKNDLVPMAPFVQKTEAWVSLALKRMIRYAAENGFDRVAWTNGEQQADRYDLSKHIHHINWSRLGDGSYNFQAYGKGYDDGDNAVLKQSGVKPEGLSDYIGKEAAEKITGSKDWRGSLSNLDLKIGGEGMRAFYDDVLPKIANRLLEKVGGGRVGDVTVRSDTSPVDTGDDSLAFRMAAKVEDKLFGKKNNFLKQPGFDITPAMREQALKGMPMFSRGGEPKASRAASPQTDLFGSPEENKRKVDLFTPRGQDNLADRAKSYLASFLDSDRTFNWWHRSVGTQYHKATVSAPFRRVFNEGQAFLTDTNRFSMQAEEKAPQVLLRVEGIKDLTKRPPSPAEIETLGRTLFEGTLFGGADPTKGKVFTDEELKAKGLNEKQVGLYRQVRASIDDSIDTVAKSTIARLLRTYEMKIDRDMSLADVTTDALEQLEAHRAEQNLAIEAQTEDPAERHRVSQQIDAVQTAIGQVDAIRKRAVALQQGGYMPLMRFGRHSVNVFEIDDAGKPKEQFFGLYESQGEANRAAAALKQEFPNATIEKGMMSKEAYRIFQGISPDTIELFSEIAGLDEHPLMQQYIQMAVSERSAMKRMLKRKGVPGFDWDVPKVLANFITSNARAASGNYHHAEMLKSIEEIPKGQGDVKDEAVRLYEYLTKPQEEAAALRGYMFFHFMGGSIATAMVNMTQPVMMTAPRLAVDHNIAKVSKELGRAMLEAARQNAPTDAAGKAMKKAEDEGIVAPHEIYQLMAEAKGGIGRNIALRQFTRVWGGLFSLAEAWNRKATFLAAYRLAESTKGMDPYDYAVRVVNETQGLYNRGNRPNWARGTIGATAMTFRQYGIAYLELLKRLPAPQRALALGILVLVAGLQGLPGADDLDDILDTLGQWMGYATNSKQWKRKAIEAMFGKDIGQFVLNGASAIPAMPLDVQMRLGLGNLIPGTSMFKPSDGSDKGQEIAEAFGPAGGLAKSGFDVAREAFQGDIAGMAKAGLPASLRNAYQALEMFQTGEYRDSKNRRVVDASAQDAFVKAIGFNPTVVARESRKVNETLTNINLQKETETSIVEQWVRGIIDHKDNEVDAARERLAAWNDKNPDLMVAINKQQIARRVREARRSREERFIRSAPKEIRAGVAQELRD